MKKQKLGIAKIPFDKDRNSDVNRRSSWQKKVKKRNRKVTFVIGELRVILKDLMS